MQSQLPLGTYGAIGSSTQLQKDLKKGSTAAAPPPPLSEEEAAAERAKPSLKDLPPLFLPWVFFSVVLFTTALFESHFLSILAATTCFLICGACIFFSRGLPWRMLALVCLTMTLIGYGMGAYDKAKYVYPYLFYVRSPSKIGIDPNSRAGAVADAGYLGFQDGAHVDISRSVGYVSGSTWCAAPIVSSDFDNYASFWAVGKDCCMYRGNFRCGDAVNQSTNGGVVIKDASLILQGEIPFYATAAQMAAETYGINMARDPIYVRWNDTPESNAQFYWDGAVAFSVTAALMFLLIPPCFLLVMKCAGTSLFGGKSGPYWHPEKVDVMTFGFDLTQRVYPNYVQQDLLYSRSFWCGEVLQDYVFHFANRHIYWSCLLCHPVHPYRKWQRAVVALTVSIVLLFSTAALTAFVGQSGLKAAYIICMFLLLRNSLKLILMSYGMEKSISEFGDGHFIGGKNVRSVNSQEVMILAGFAAMAVLVALGCSSVVATAQKDLASSLRSSIDTLAYIYILDMLADLLTPFLGHDAFEGVWTLGFFGRWMKERDDFESAKAQLMVNRGNQWSSIGAEVMGVGTAQQRRPPQGGQNLEVGNQYMVPRGTIAPTTSSSPLFAQVAVKKAS